MEGFSDLKDKDKADTKRLARCGKCVNCVDKVKFGGPGTKKQALKVCSTRPHAPIPHLCNHWHNHRTKQTVMAG